METIFRILLVLHIAGGTIGLVAGIINLVRRKGSRSHKMTGRFFLYGMLTAGISSMALSAIHPNSFLFIVGVFTVYMVWTAYRYIRLKPTEMNRRSSPVDWAVSSAMLLAALLFIILGIRQLFQGNAFSAVFLVFGLLGLFFVWKDYNNYRGRPSAKNYWLLEHLQRMTGTFIAASTAFLVVNGHDFPLPLPSAVFWLLPTVILTPLIVIWSGRYKVRS